MEVETAQSPSPSGSDSSSAAYPRWVTLDRYCLSSVVVLFPKTLAAARTSNGHTIQVSLCPEEPPAMSLVCVRFSPGVRLNYSIVMAAHGDSLLLVVSFRQGYHDTLDYFVYNAGDAAADPPRQPSLLLLLSYYLTESEDDRRRSRYYYYHHRRYDLDLRRYNPVWNSDPLNPELDDGTGIICPRRGEDEDEVVVAKLRMVAVSKGDGTENTKVVAELLLFRSGAWSVKRPWIYCGKDGEFGELHSEWKTSSVFPVGDRTLCWVDDSSDSGGVLICDVLEENPCLQYVLLPSVPTACYGRKVCATAGNGGSSIKFVNIFPRCCCGGAGASDCRRSHHAYTVNTWTLRMDGGMRMEWVMDGMVDATELWSLDAYGGLPRVPLRFPVVSMDDSNVVCFALCESHHVKHGGGDKTLWLLMVNMRSKTIQSVSCYPDWSTLPGPVLMSSNVSYYLNPYPTCSSDGTGTSTEDQSQVDIVEMKKKRDGDNGTNSMLPSPCTSAATRTEPAAQASEILAAFQDIPSYGLARDDMLKAYAILSGDNGCRVRSLLTLPMKLRKDWLLMEIKAAEA